MKPMLNLITGKCEGCGDDFGGMAIELVRGLRDLAKKAGPLRDQLTIAVAMNVERYPTGCTCGGPKQDPPQPHAKNCPAGDHAQRYLDHLVEPKPADESKPADELTEGDVRFVAGLRERLRDAAEGDVRSRCPECGRALTPAGQNRVECKPCGVSLVKDTSAAIDFAAELRPLEVWHCPACNTCFAFRQIPIANAVVLAGDDQVPIRCFGCGGPLEQWSVMRPLVSDEIESGPANPNLKVDSLAAAAVLFGGKKGEVS